MMFKKPLFFLLFFVVVHSFSQADGVLFTIDNQEITTKEFDRVYNKNIDIVADKNQKGIDNYLELYINYKLKVRQAQDLKLDTISSYKKELSSYKKQIMAPYLRDNEFIDKLVKEAYDRSLVEINASHILIKLAQKSTDTAAAYTKIMEAKAKIEKGEDFISVAVEYSEDPSVATNKGDLGYFSVFDMVYPFEEASYSTEKNNVSNPFRTRFGYHIIYVHDIRKARGEVEAAHIMIKLDSVSSRTKIDELYQKLESGEEFSSVALNFSDDDYSAKKGGDLGRFGSGKMVPEFDEVIFSMENIGSYSQPFKTQFGWHIVMLTDKLPVKSFEEQEKELTAKVKRGDRASIVSNSIVHKIKGNYTIKVNKKALKLFESGTWKTDQKLDEVFMTLEGETISKQQLVDFIGDREYASILLEKFKEDQILNYYKLHLVETNQEFAFLYQEYKEGLLLFELMQQRIWDKSKDSIGLEAYYDLNKNNYEQSLEDDKGRVLNDYQGHLEKLWINELHTTYNVKINNAAVEKLKGTLNEE